MRCTACQTDNLSNRLFCSHCGKPLPAENPLPPVALCTSCGADLNGKRFCPSCGADSQVPNPNGRMSDTQSNLVTHGVSGSQSPEIVEPVVPETGSIELSPVIFCKTCGANLKGKRFCPSCGADSQASNQNGRMSDTQSNHDTHGVAGSQSPEIVERAVPEASEQIIVPILAEPIHGKKEDDSGEEKFPPNPIPELVEKVVANKSPADEPSTAAAVPVLEEPTTESQDTSRYFSSAKRSLQNTVGGVFCKNCGAALGGNRFCPHCGDDNGPVSRETIPGVLPKKANQGKIWAIFIVIVVALLAGAGYFAYRYWMKSSLPKVTYPIAATESPAKPSAKTASTASTPSALAVTSNTASTVSAIVSTSSTRSGKVSPSVAVHGKPIIKGSVVTPAPIRPVIPIAHPVMPEQYAAPKPAPNNGPSTKQQMQKMLSPFGGNN